MKVPIQRCPQSLRSGKRVKNARVPRPGAMVILAIFVTLLLAAYFEG
jgi:hypothetical protein